ncbi:hypothetical protein FBU30_003255 [Linnemannia zychae]|nr:hypothetical protein FBU30_003255 [Linnemannia zychae]
MACIDPALAIPFDLSILTISHKKDHSAVKAVIVGGGIAGLSLAIMMAQAGMEYIILERSTSLEASIGSSLTIGPPILRLMEQIGLLSEIEAVSLEVGGLTIVDAESRKIGRLEGYDRDRYGYPMRIITRYDLHRILLSRVPKEYIHHGKLVVETLQNPSGVSCKCSDGSTYYGDIIVGADGAHSLTRERMYTQLKEESKLADADMEPSSYEHISIGGVTVPLDKDFYPAAHHTIAEMRAIITKDVPYSFWYMPVGNGRVAWSITNPQSPKQKIYRYSRTNISSSTNNSHNGHSSTTTITSSSTATHAIMTTSSSSSIGSNASSHVPIVPEQTGHGHMSASQLGMNTHDITSSNARYSNKPISPPLSRTSSSAKIYDDWFVPSNIDLEVHFKDLLNARCALGMGTVRDFISKTPKETISAIDSEERLYKTWYYGRIVLIGDACHQQIATGGQGAVQSILDGVCLVNLLHDMEFNTPSEITKVFKKYQAKRSSLAKASIEENTQMEKVFHGHGLVAGMMRKFIFNSLWSFNIKNDKYNNNRPQLSFLPFVEDRGHSKANRQKVSSRLSANN